MDHRDRSDRGPESQGRRGGGGGELGDERGDALFRRRGRRRVCRYCADKTLVIDYKDSQQLRYFITDRGKIVPRRISGACAKHQRSITTAIKRARLLALVPFTLSD
jgi:small subunit ribosomal protein S18